MNTPNPDQQLHAFKTFLGLPPSTDDPPACGAVLTPAYGTIPKTGRCAECDRLVTAQRVSFGKAVA